MGDYAASGGYYIACTADSIVCQPSTITGSIGIFGIIPDFSGLTQKIGVDFDVQKNVCQIRFSNYYSRDDARREAIDATLCRKGI